MQKRKMNALTTEKQLASHSNESPIPTVASDELLQGGKTLIIRHGGYDYRLQVTRSQKLILTK